MANLRDIKTRLRGVRKTQQITRAMKMVATVKLRHAQTALENGRLYAERMRELAANLLAGIYPPPADNPFFKQRTIKKTLFVVISSDRGLCGSMNANIFRQVLRSVDDLSAIASHDRKQDIHLLLIGRKANDFFKTRERLASTAPTYKIRQYIPFSTVDAGQLGGQICDLYRQGEFDRIDLFYNKSTSALQHSSTRATFLPLDLQEQRKGAIKTADNFLFEPDCEEMLEDVIRALLVSKMRAILMQAEVAEQAARMVMMDLATKNADDLITDMQLTMNKLRQLSITLELADITTGAAALI